MACRVRTRQFIQFRTTAIRKRSHKGGGGAGAWQSEDEIALVSAVDGDVEQGFKHTLPPEWIDTVEEIQFSISRVTQRIKELHALHDKHLNRPTLDDGTEEEYAIEIMTQDITSMFQSTQHAIQGLSVRARECRSAAEQKMCKNVMTSLAQELQKLSNGFRQSQSTYLQRIRGREEKKRQFFGGSELLMTEEENEPDEELYDKEFTAQQLALLENDTAQIEQRDREIMKIVQSIKELGDIFKELSTLIIDQGTILDRIDYNLEQVSTDVASGLVQLQKGEKYQKKSRKKMVCILILFVAVLVMIVLLAIR